MKFRQTKYGIAICPHFQWQSENIERQGQQDDDVSLTFCSHDCNESDHEGNCNEKACPIVRNIP